MRSLGGGGGVDGGADDADLVGSRHDLEVAALQRAQLDHFEQQAVQQTDVDESHYGSGDEKGSRALHVDASGRRCGQCAVTKRDKFLAPSIAGARIFKNFLGFEIEEAQAHGAAPEGSFEMSLAAAAAALFLRVQANDRMPAFP